ncbi:T9SS type B sorting domain-containing protein [Aquimarina rhabdastrellae]
MYKNIVYLLILIYSSNVFSQGEANNWYFGINGGITFDNGIPQVVNDGALQTIEGVCTISDKDGNLLFYSDGRTVWNKRHRVIQDGSNLFGNFSSTQSSIGVPYPENNDLYYLLTTDAISGADRGLRYTLLDMSSNGGLGSIVEKNILLQESSTEKLTAVGHANGIDYWIVAHERENNVFKSYLVTNAGISTTPVVSSIGASYNSRDEVGYLKISPNGKKIAAAISETLEIFDFDISSGRLTNNIRISLPAPPEDTPYGIEFSPNGRYLYITIANVTDEVSSMYQYNVSLADAVMIENSQQEIISVTTCTNNPVMGALQLAPDGNIYVAHTIGFSGYDYLGVIRHSNTSNPEYDCQGINLAPGKSTLGLPNYIQSFFVSILDAENFCLGEETQFMANSMVTIDAISWDFGDGMISTEIAPTHIYQNSGVYTVIASITSGGRTIEEEIEIEIYEAPQSNTVTNYILEENPFDGIAEFDLMTKNNEILGTQSATEFNVSYYITQDDADNATNSLPNLYTNISNPQTIYARISNSNNVECYAITTFLLEVTQGTSISNVSDFSICSLTPNTATFDLDSKNDEVLDGQNPADFNISYHLSQDNADNNVNPLTSPYPYTDTSMPLPIFVRLEAISDPTQFDTTSFNLIVSQAPTVTTPNDIIVCDDNTNDGVESFDFTTTISDILNGQDPNVFSVTLFASQNDLDNNTNSLPAIYQNTQPQQQIFAKIENTSNPNCVEQTSFMIGVSYSPFSVNPQDVIVCKDPTVNNTVTIDLSDYVLEILGSQNPADFTVTYHANENDADADQNPLPDAFSTTNNREQIVYRIENNLNTDCYINTTLTLIVNNSPSIGTLTDVILCDDNNDGTVTFDLSSKDSEALDGQDPTVYQVLYFASQTDLDNNANALPSDYQNTQAQEQIFVRIYPINDVDCFNQSSFNLTVSPTPIIASTSLALDNCGTMGVAAFDLIENNDDILGNQSATAVTITYHTSSDDAMNNTNAIAAPENYTSQQDGEEIFIRIESNTNTACFATDSFILNVFEIPTAGIVTDLELCDANANIINYDLSFSFPEILGTQDAALFDISFYTSQADADARTNELDLNQETSETSTTVFARIENIGNTICYQTTSFNILKRESPVLTIADEVFICPGETLTVTADAGYDDYEWSTGETTESIDITTPGEYSVTVTANYNAINCTTTKTFMVTASIVPQSIDVIVVDFKPASQNNIKVIAAGDGDFEYSIDGSSFQESNVFTNVEPGDYTAFVRDKGQCVILSKEFYVLGYPLFFTPNGDGFNEVWQILNPDREPENRIYIFDRYGKLLTNFTQGDIGWDGTYNGKQMPATDYWFKVERINGQTIKGHFTLKR